MKKAGETFLERANPSDEAVKLPCLFGQHVGWKGRREKRCNFKNGGAMRECL
jgi:hypothetical protein